LLNALREEYGGDLEIVGFPSNQFNLQEPGSNDEIPLLLKYVRPGDGYEPNFPMFRKLQVNGDGQDALYTELKSVCPPVKMDIGNPDMLFWSPIRVGDITWNFQKFLVDAEGVPYKRYDPAVLPSQLKDDIDTLIQIRDSATSPPDTNDPTSTSGATSSKLGW
jgi:glutathione peroxidase